MGSDTRRIKFDHEKIIKYILDNSGIIFGGYVRAWASAGEPVDDGWEDIDCRFPSPMAENQAIKKIYELCGDDMPLLDNQWFGKSMEDFYCNCWYFDGKLSFVEPAKSKFSFEEMNDMARNKIAKCMIPFDAINYTPERVAKMLWYGWKIVNYDDSHIPDRVLEFHKNKFVKKTIKRIIGGKTFEKIIYYN